MGVLPLLLLLLLILTVLSSETISGDRSMREHPSRKIVSKYLKVSPIVSRSGSSYSTIIMKVGYGFWDESMDDCCYLKSPKIRGPTILLHIPFPSLSFGTSGHENIIEEEIVVLFLVIVLVVDELYHWSFANISPMRGTQVLLQL